MRFLIALLINVACGFAQASEITGQASVIDGDTLAIRDERVRLHGIDAFEASQRCGGQPGWPCGRRAAFALEGLIGGRNVRCEIRGRDRYKRAIGVCFVGSVDLNEALVRAGFALAYRRYSKDYVAAEAAAKADGAGAWSGVFVEPWEFRKR